jgi:hypothetical protein
MFDRENEEDSFDPSGSMDKSMMMELPASHVASGNQDNLSVI